MADSELAAADPLGASRGGAPARRGRPRDSGVDAAIRSAVMNLLGEVSYAHRTIEQVVARAMVSKDSLYRRSPNKPALVTDALHRARAVPKVPDTGSLPGDMRAFLRSLLQSAAPRRRRCPG